MPGGDKLAAELRVGRDTVEAALKLLEKEGFLENQGRRRGRLIVPHTASGGTPRIRVAILLHEAADRRLDYMVELEHELELAGHTVVYAAKCLYELGMDIGRVARVVELGHRRIMLLARTMRRLPLPGAGEQAFLDTLKSHGISPSPYYLPHRSSFSPERACGCPEMSRWSARITTTPRLNGADLTSPTCAGKPGRWCCGCYSG